MLILRVVFAVEEFRRGLQEGVSLAAILPVVGPAFVISGTNVHAMGRTGAVTSSAAPDGRGAVL